MGVRLSARLLALLVVGALVLVVGACGGGDDGDSDADGTTTVAGGDALAALVSDVGKFTDHGFNQSQLAGLDRAAADLGVEALPLQSNSVSDYIPNLTTAVHRDPDIVIAAGFLLADATATMAKRFPETNFAITDFSATAAPFGDEAGRPKFDNVQGLTYASNEAGCLVGVLAAKAAERAGKKVIGAVGGVQIPPVEIWIAGYRFCAQKAVPGTRVLVGYSQDFVATDKCKTVAENQIARDAQVLFQVAGGCGIGTLKAADQAGIWGIGVDVDQYDLANRVLTSGIKRVDNGVYDAIKRAQAGRFVGGEDLLFNLENDGVGVGKINPAVPEADIELMDEYKAQIIDGSLDVPSSL